MPFLANTLISQYAFIKHHFLSELPGLMITVGKFMRHKLSRVWFLFISILLAGHANSSLGEQRQIALQCGNYQVAITCGKGEGPEYENDKRQCSKNELSFTDAKGQKKIFVQQKKIIKRNGVTQTPVGIECQTGNDGNSYVLVEFNNGPIACGPCKIIDLFQSNGKRITVNSINLDKTDEKLGLKFRKSNYIEEYGKR